MTSARVIKLIASLGFILITIALLVAWNSPATGYESSIYQSTPPVVWIGLIGSMAVGIGIAVYQASRREEPTNLWLLGYALIVLSSLIVVSLHIIRGYALLDAAGDTGAHLGMTQEILTTGHINRQNFYPISHIYLAQSSLVLGLDFVMLQKWLVPIFGLLGMIFIYFLARAILTDRKQVILASIAGVALLDFYHLYFTPNSLGNMVLPLALYLVVQDFVQRALSWKVLLLLTVFLLAPFHPLPAFALFLVLATLWLTTRLIPRPETNSPPGSSAGFGFNSTLLLIMLVWGITWISSFYIWEGTIENLHTLATEGGVTQLTRLASDIELAGAKGYSVVQQFLKVYGVTAGYAVLAALALPLLYRRIRISAGLSNLAALYGPLAAFGISAVLFYLTNVPFGALRFLTYIKLISALFVGFLLFELIEWLNRLKWTKALSGLIVGVLLFAALLSTIAALYPSPYTLSITAQNTLAELDGTSWFLHQKDTRFNSAGWYFAPYGFASFQLTPQERRQRQDISIYVTEQLPDHLGYDKYARIGEYYEQDIYVVLREMNRRLYVDNYPTLAGLRLESGDFDKLEEDRSIDKLYENGEFDVWYVHSQ
jgi:hypothetical protein